MKILIIGGVAAGATAAAKARRVSSEADITVLEAGPDISFANCGLPYYIGGDIKSRSKLILQSPESFRDQYNVTVHTDTEAVRIDRERKIVTALDKKSGEHRDFPYDTLILAQGGKPLVPPIPGADKRHVFSLWTLADMDRIDQYIRESGPQSAVIVGGGFIGLEMAEALRKRNLKVRVVERLPQVMAQLESEIAGYLQEELASYGVEVYTDTAVTSIDDGNVSLSTGESIPADMVLMSVGVRPTLNLARDSGLETGESGGLLVDEQLKTSDENIYAAGDMCEINHVIDRRKVRIPLAGPANRQGRIAAQNALGGSVKYSGSQGTSIVRVFEAVAGSTGLSLDAAKDAGFDADSIVIHKEHHTGYYPGAESVTVLLVFDRATGRILGGQTAGYAGADRRLDVIATAAAGGLTVDDLAEIDFAYSPPLGTANDALNMAAFTAQNKISGYSPSVRAFELDSLFQDESPVIFDFRDYFQFRKSNIPGSVNLEIKDILVNAADLPKNKTILVIDETGKKGHQALRTLIQAGYTNVLNVSGGYISIERQARVSPFTNTDIPLFPLEKKQVRDDASSSESPALKKVTEKGESSGPGDQSVEGGVPGEYPQENGPLILDVRTPAEFSGGAYPEAINVPLDELANRIHNLAETDTDIILYCASGARSAYGVRILQQMGYGNVKNGGGIMQMMSSLPA